MAGGAIFNSFDDDEFVDTSTQTPTQDLEAEELIDPVDDLIDDYDEEMNEAEHKINLAGYYRQLAKGGIFKDKSEAAKIVDNEVRAFARERMAALLNLSSKQAEEKKIELPFTDGQVAVLQWLADRYHEKQQQAPQSQPMMRSPAPPAQPQAAQPIKPALPQVTSLAPPSTASKAPKKPQQQKRQTPVQKIVKGKADYSLIADNTPFEEGGKMYKLVTNPDNGQRVKLKVHMDQKVTSPHRIPMPSVEAMGAVSMQQSHEALATTERVVQQATGSLTRR